MKKFLLLYVSLFIINNLVSQCPSTIPNNNIKIANNVCVADELYLKSDIVPSPLYLYEWQSTDINNINWITVGLKDSLKVNPNNKQLKYRLIINCGTVRDTTDDFKFIFEDFQLNYTGLSCNDSMKLKINHTLVDSTNSYRWLFSNDGNSWQANSSLDNKDSIKIVIPKTQPIFVKVISKYCNYTNEIKNIDGFGANTNTLDLDLSNINIVVANKLCAANKIELKLNNANSINFMDSIAWFRSFDNFVSQTNLNNNSISYIDTLYPNKITYYKAILYYCNNKTLTTNVYKIDNNLGDISKNINCITKNIDVDYTNRANVKLESSFVEWAGTDNSVFAPINDLNKDGSYSTEFVNNLNYKIKINLKLCESSTILLDTTPISDSLVAIFNIGKSYIKYLNCPTDSLLLKSDSLKAKTNITGFTDKWYYLKDKSLTNNLLIYTPLPYTEGSDSIIIPYKVGLSVYFRAISICEDKFNFVEKSTESKSFVPFQVVAEVSNCFANTENKLLNDSIYIEDSDSINYFKGVLNYKWYQSSDKSNFIIINGETNKTIITPNNLNMYYMRGTSVCPISNELNSNFTIYSIVVSPINRNGNAAIVDQQCLNTKVEIRVNNNIIKAGNPYYFWQVSEDDIIFKNLVTSSANLENLIDTTKEYYKYFRRITMWCDENNLFQIDIDSTLSVPAVRLLEMPWCQNIDNMNGVGNGVIFECFNFFSPACPNITNYATVPINTAASGGVSGNCFSHQPSQTQELKADGMLVMPAVKLEKGKVYRVSFYHKETGTNLCWDSLYVTWGTQMDRCNIQNKIGSPLTRFSFDKYSRYWVDFIPSDTGIFYFGIVYKENDEATRSNILFDNFCIKEILPCTGVNIFSGIVEAPEYINSRVTDNNFDMFDINQRYCVNDTVPFTYRQSTYNINDEKNNNFDYYGMSYQVYRKINDPEFGVVESSFSPIKNNSSYLNDSVPEDFMANIDYTRCHLNKRDMQVTNILVTDTMTYYKIVGTCEFDKREFSSDSVLIDGTHAIPYCENWASVGEINNTMEPHPNCLEIKGGDFSAITFASEQRLVSSAATGFEPYKSSANVAGFWSPKNISNQEFLIIDFGNSRSLTHFVAAGELNNFVRAVRISYSQDGVNFIEINQDIAIATNTATKVALPYTVNGRYIKVRPVLWSGTPKLDIDFLFDYSVAHSNCPTCWKSFGTNNLPGFWAFTQGWGNRELNLPVGQNSSMRSFDVASPGNAVTISNAVPGNDANTKILCFPPVRLIKNKSYFISFRWSDNREKNPLTSLNPLENVGRSTDLIESLKLVVVKGNYQFSNGVSFINAPIVGAEYKDLASNLLTDGINAYHQIFEEYLADSTSTYSFAIVAKLKNTNTTFYRFLLDEFCIDTIPTSQANIATNDCNDSPTFKSPMYIKAYPNGVNFYPFVSDPTWCNGEEVAIEFGIDHQSSIIPWKKNWKHYWEVTKNDTVWSTYDSSNSIKYKLSYKYQKFRLKLVNQCGKGWTSEPLNVISQAGQLPYRENFDEPGDDLMPCWRVNSQNLSRFIFLNSKMGENSFALSKNSYLGFDFGPTQPNNNRNNDFNLMMPEVGLSKNVLYRVSFWYKDNGYSNLFDTIELGYTYDRNSFTIPNGQFLSNILTGGKMKNLQNGNYKYFTAEIRPTFPNNQNSIDSGFNFVARIGSAVNTYMYLYNLDNFEVKQKYNEDALVIQIDSPVSKCNISNTSVRVRIMNLGINQISNFPVRCKIGNDPTVYSTIYTGNLNSNQTDYVTIPNVNFTQFNEVPIYAWTDLPNDQDRWDDTLNINIFNNFMPETPNNDTDTVCRGVDYIYNLQSVNSKVYWFVDSSQMYPTFIGNNIEFKNFQKDTHMYVSRGTAVDYYSNIVDFSETPPTYSNTTQNFLFDNISNKILRLRTIDVYSNNIGSLSLNISQYTKAVPNCLTKVFNVQKGKNTIKIDWDIPAGTDFIITNTGTALLAFNELNNWNSRGNVNAFVIKNPGNNNNNYLYNLFFTDLKCETDRKRIDFILKESPIFYLKDTVRVCQFPTYQLCPTITNLFNDTYTYLWNTGSVDSCFGLSTTGDYILSITNQLGCTSKDSVRIIVDPTPKLNISDQIVCKGLSTIFDSQIDTTNNIINWSTGGMKSKETISKVGVYFATAYNVRNFCNFTDTFELKNEIVPDLNLGVDRVECGDSYDLSQMIDGVIFSNIIWGGNGQISNSGIVSTVGNNRYWVNAIHTLTGCKVTDTIEINLVKYPKVDLGLDQSVCNSNTSLSNLITNTQELYYEWNTGATNSTLFVANTGKYTLEVVDKLFGCSARDSVFVKFSSLPQFNFPADFKTCDQKATLSAPIGGNGEIYKWSTGESTNEIEILKSGTYCLTITNACNKSYFDCITVEVLGTVKQIIDMLPDTVIGCTKVKLTASSSSSSNSILWSNGENTNSIDVNKSGPYSVSLFNQCGNFSKATVVIIDKKPKASFTIEKVDSMTIWCNNTSSTGNKYLWDFGDKTTSNEYLPIHKYQNEGKFLVNLKVSNSCGEANFSQSTPVMHTEKDSGRVNINNRNYGIENAILYPNPSNINTTILAKGIPNNDYRIELIDNLGQILYQYNVQVDDNELKYEIQTSILANGFYFIKLYDGDNFVKVLRLTKID